MSRLSGLTAIVTGSSSGIGRGIALAFAREGIKHVICVDVDAESQNPWERPNKDSDDPNDVLGRDGEGELVATHELICQRHGSNKATFFKCDISLEMGKQDEGGQKCLGMADMMQAAMPILDGRLDIMVNSAGVGIFAIPTHETPLGVWEEHMSVNAKGSFLGMKHALAQFVKQEQDSHGFRGNIINISGIGAQVGIRECAAYTASKAAIVGLAKTVAIDYGTQGIRCNTLLPGYILTPMLQRPLDSEGPVFREFLDTWIPLGHIGRPRDMAGAAVWLANAQESGYVTGVSLQIDGGFTAR